MIKNPSNIATVIPTNNESLMQTMALAPKNVVMAKVNNTDMYGRINTMATTISVLR